MRAKQMLSIMAKSGLTVTKPDAAQYPTQYNMCFPKKALDMISTLSVTSKARDVHEIKSDLVGPNIAMSS